MQNLNYTEFYEMIAGGKAAKVIDHLIIQAPEYQKDLILIQSRWKSNVKMKNAGTVSMADFRVEETNINNSLISFLDSLAKGDSGAATDFLQKDEEENPGPVDELLTNQLEHTESTIKEYKTFRVAVGLLFLIAVVFSVVVILRHFQFLSEEIEVIALLSTNIFLYVAIGILALYALSLIIKGTLFNQTSLNFYQKILKRK